MSALKTPHALAQNHLPAWQKRALDFTLIGLVISGVAWLCLHYSVGAGSENGLPHGAEFWLMRAHGAFSFAALFVLGTIAALHIPRGWRRRQRIKSAVTMLAAWAVSIITAYLLYYFSGENSRTAIGLIHAGVALFLWLIIFFHRRKIH